MADSWDRQQKETARAFEAFTRYRSTEVHKRSLRALAEDYKRDGGIGKSTVNLRQLEEWSSKYQWQIRCQEYDSFLDRQAIADHVKAVREMRARQTKLGRNLQTMAGKALMDKAGDFVDPATGEVRKGAGDGLAKSFTSDLVKMADVGARLERTGLGEPESLVKNIITIDKLDDIVHQHGVAVEEAIAEVIQDGAVREALFSAITRRWDRIYLAVPGIGGAEAGE